MLGTKEHYDLMAQFEKDYKYMRLDKETDLEIIRRGQIYCSGETNNLFKAYESGYSFSKCYNRE